MRIVDLAVRVQPAERIVADRAKSNDLLAWLERKGIVDVDGRHLGIKRQILGTSIVRSGGIVRLPALGSRHW
ncbi:hypothetical protein ACVI1K_007457 [Bradyrhizobium sp. USDA 4508]